MPHIRHLTKMYMLWLLILTRILYHLKLTRHRVSTSMYSLTFRVRVSNATHAPIANPPNSAQLGAALPGYHSPKLHPGPCSSVGIRPRTDRHTDTPQYIAPLFSARVYCGHGRRSQLLLSSCYIGHYFEKYHQIWYGLVRSVRLGLWLVLGLGLGLNFTRPPPQFFTAQHAFAAAQIPLELHILCSTAR